MNDMAVTEIWMAGVMTVMAAFGLVAAVGLWRRRLRTPGRKQTR